MAAATVPGWPAPPEQRETRALLICVAGSILLHAAVLLFVPEWHQGTPGSSVVLSARLVQRSAAPEAALAPPPAATASVAQPAPVPQPPEPPRPKVQASRPTVPLAVPAPKAAALPLPQPSAPPQPAPAAQTPAPAAAPQPASPAQAPAAVASLEPQPSARAGPAPPSTEGADKGGAPILRDFSGADAQALELFKQDLRIAMIHYRSYPPEAREKGWKGTTEIHLLIGANGMTQSAKVKTSSGYQVLDDEALVMYRKAKGLVQVPPVLRGRAFEYDQAVVFGLDN